MSQAELAGRLEVTQGAISKLEHADDVRLSTLRQYLEVLGARLELVAVFDDEGERRVPVHLGKADREPAA
ncbi:MAG: Helix-turn-helix domain [Acidimicrobiaceae bacterium]